jgi:pimeloyl-ACP methyl ester carboxylesterase
MSKQVSNQKTHFTNTLHRTVTIDGLSIFYRESGEPTNPKLVLLHGWPSSSHQYRNLIPALADHFHIVAPDYPGFGNSDLPSTKEFSYTFDRLSEIIEDFLKAIGFTHSLWTFRAGLWGTCWLQDHCSSSGLAGMAYNTEHQCLRGWFYQSLGWIP